MVFKIKEEIKLQELNLKKYALFNNNYKIIKINIIKIIIKYNFN